MQRAKAARLVPPVPTVRRESLNLTAVHRVADLVHSRLGAGPGGGGGNNPVCEGVPAPAAGAVRRYLRRRRATTDCACRPMCSDRRAADNESDMARIVQKFGGTSVADLERIKNAACRVKREVDAGNEVAVVVS